MRGCGVVGMMAFQGGETKRRGGEEAGGAKRRGGEEARMRGGRLLSAVCCPLSTIRRLPSAVRRPLSADRRPPFAIHTSTGYNLTIYLHYLQVERNEWIVLYRVAG
jgi:hypothetical protein